MAPFRWLKPAVFGALLLALPLSGCAKPVTEMSAPVAAPAEAPAPTPTQTATPTPEPARTEPTAPPTSAPASAAPASPAASARPSKAPTTTAPAKPRATAAATAPAAGPAIMDRGTSGDNVRDLQARLKQLGWFAEKVTGYYGSTTAASVSGFQGKRSLPPTGAVDRATLTALQRMTRTPASDEVADAPKPAPTKPAQTTSAPAQPGGLPPGIDRRCMTGRVLCISKAQNKMRWMVDGKVQTTLAVRFGTKELPTRNGSFNVQWKSRNHVSTIYHTPMPFALFFSGGQAVHYSPDFAANGYKGGSHGCVNVRDRATMASLFDTVRVGDKVVVY